MKLRGFGAAVLLPMLALPGACVHAQSVALSGMLGNRALLMIGNGPPRSIAPGDSYEGVKVISTSGDQAVVEIGGRRQTLRVGDTPASFGGQESRSGGGTITITAGSDGHFTTPGSIDGHAVQFIVDTGASMISMSVPQAERAGLNYRAGQPMRVNTANGATRGWRITLDSVRVGDVQVSDVDAVVTPQPMTYVLLGNSFLTRFRMQQNADVMTLQRRY